MAFPSPSSTISNSSFSCLTTFDLRFPWKILRPMRPCWLSFTRGRLWRSDQGRRRATIPRATFLPCDEIDTLIYTVFWEDATGWSNGYENHFRAASSRIRLKTLRHRADDEVGHRHLGAKSCPCRTARALIWPVHPVRRRASIGRAVGSVRHTFCGIDTRIEASGRGGVRAGRGLAAVLQWAPGGGTTP